MWVTSPRADPFNVEWLRFEPDTPGDRTAPHRAARRLPCAGRTVVRSTGTRVLPSRSRSATASLTRRVRRGRRRRRRVHAVREPGRGGMVLSSRTAARRSGSRTRRRSTRRRRGPCTRSSDVSVEVAGRASSCASSGRAAAARRRSSGRCRGSTQLTARPGHARRLGRRRASAARDRDDLPGREPAAVAQPAPEPRVPVRDQAAQAGRGADHAAARGDRARGLREGATRASSPAGCSSERRSSARSRRTRRCC